MANQLDKEALLRLRKMLPPGSVELISWKTGLTEASVRQVLYKPERYNQTVVAIAISIAEKHKLQFLKLKNKLAAIVE